MNPWYGKGAVLAASVVLVALRAPHGQRSRSVPVAKNRKGLLETALLTFAWLGFFLPLFWVSTPWFAFADFPLEPIPYGAGLGMLAAGLWLFHRSHADLGTNHAYSPVDSLPNGMGCLYRLMRHGERVGVNW